MNKIICALAFFLAAGPVSTTLAAEDPSPGVEEKSGLQLSQRVGFGTDTIPLAYSYSYNNFYMDNLTALSVRYWLSETTAVEVLGAYKSYSNQGVDFDQKLVQDPHQSWGAGLGLKFNVRRPVPNLFIQVVLKASYAYRNDQSRGYIEAQTSSNETLGAFAGVGFEYFIPFLDALSVEAGVGYMGATSYSISETRYNQTIYNYPDSDYGRTTLYGDIVTRGMTPATLSIHFYF